MDTGKGEHWYTAGVNISWPSHVEVNMEVLQKTKSRPAK